MRALREYWQKTRRHWLWLVFTFVAGAAWVLDVLFGWQLRGGSLFVAATLVCLCVAQFLAFRDVLKERDQALEDLAAERKDRPLLVVDYACESLHGEHSRLRNNPRDPKPLVIRNRGKDDAFNVNIDPVTFQWDIASFATIPRVDGMGSVEVTPSIVGTSNTVSVYSDHLAETLWRDRIAAIQRHLEVQHSSEKLRWRLRLVYEDARGKQYESLCDMCYDGGDGTLRSVFVRSDRLKAETIATR